MTQKDFRNIIIKNRILLNDLLRDIVCLRGSEKADNKKEDELKRKIKELLTEIDNVYIEYYNL